MTKKFYKQLVLAVAISVAVATPLAASAACPILTTLRTRAEEHFAERSDALGDRHQAFLEKLAVSDTRVAAVVAARRAEQDRRFAETINRLKEGEADTTAIAALETAAEAAIQKERTAIDAAQVAFLAGRADVLASYLAETQSLLDDFHNELLLALDTADAACTARGRLTAADRTRLRKAYDAARARFAARRQTLAAETPLAAVRKQRDSAIKQAHDTYQKDMGAAISAFKEAAAR